MDAFPKDKKPGRVILRKRKSFFFKSIISVLLDDLQMLSLSASDQLEGFLNRSPEITLIPDSHN